MSKAEKKADISALPDGVLCTGAKKETALNGTHPDKEFDIQTKDVAVKYDNTKARFDLIPPEALFELADLYRIGAVKYEDRNWEKGMSYGRLFSAMMRHAWAWMCGEQCDPEDGQHHMVSVAWCALALLTYERRKIGEDDRPKLERNK